MGNVKKKKVEPVNDEPTVEKVVSFKRVAIASVICIFITGTIIWSLSLAAQKLVDTGTAPIQKQDHTPANVRLPQKGDAAYVIQETKKNINEFSWDHYTATGSAARSVIDTLQNLQQSEFGIEDYFCNIFCN
ncbi:MAG TPA: hypothetical protein PLD54_02245 [Candidatus Levybacteria bacterium]|nr:hypothetical protein [Candidatus Levybacteria bacterium]